MAGTGRIAGVLAVSSASAIVGVATGVQDLVGQSFLAAGVTLAVVAMISWVRRAHHLHLRERELRTLGRFIDSDPVAGLVTDSEGVVRVRNAAARARFGDGGHDEDVVAGLLRTVLADPSHVVHRLATRAAGEGSASEEVVTRLGHVRLSARRLGGGALLWRIEELHGRATNDGFADRLPFPMLSTGRAGTVLFMNEAARDFVGQRVKTLDRLFVAPRPDRAGLCEVSTKDGPVPAAVEFLDRPGGRKEIYLLPLEKDRACVDPGLAALPVAMLKVGLDGRVRDINPMAVRLLGNRIGAGDDFAQAIRGLDRPLEQWLSETVEGRAQHRSEFVRLARQDREAFVQVSLAPVHEENEDLVIAVLHDATDLKTMEAQFVQGQKMQAIGQLAGGIAHDFNNLLTAISGHCDLLMLRHDQGDTDFGDLVQIHQNANRAAALVGQLLAFSRKQTLRPETLDLRDTLADLAHLLNRLVGERITLTLSHDPVLPAVQADKRQLEQVIMNLVVNARDAMPGGGEIRIQTEAVTLDTPLSRDRATVPAGEYVVVKVSDQGIGIEPAKRDKIFEPFYTTKRAGEGTGLGLSTVYGIVKQMGGFIFLDSVPGQGTEFTLYFPVCEEGEVEPDVATDTASDDMVAQTGRGVVLLVEDEAPVRAFASRALRLRGFTVLEAESAEDALRLLADGTLHVDVFVTDVVMPGMDGPSWVREALGDRPDARVVFMSGYSEGAFGETEARIPNSVFLPKPFSLNQLTETVRRQIG